MTTDLVYLRLQGPDGAYQGNYDRQTLENWSGAVRSGRHEGIESIVILTMTSQVMRFVLPHRCKLYLHRRT